jgi:hypothetical protein
VEWGDDGGTGAVFATRPIADSLLALALWRARFEVGFDPRRLVRKREGLQLRPDLLSWPAGGCVDLSAWGHFVYECWLEDRQVARRWNDTIAPFGDMYDGGRGVAWREAITRWLPRLSPKYRRFPPGVTWLAHSTPGASGFAISVVRQGGATSDA